MNNKIYNENLLHNRKGKMNKSLFNFIEYSMRKSQRSAKNGQLPARDLINF